MLNVCLYLERENCLIEEDYERIYKRLFKFLYANPDFSFSVAFTGAEVDYYAKEHPEIYDILRQLLKRSQVEVLGGGYYDPIMSLLSPKDRTLQLDLFSTTIKEYTGHRPYGVVLSGSIWSAKLIPSFYSYLMKYVLLDSYVIPLDKRSLLPISISEQGKSIVCFATYRGLVDNPSQGFISGIKAFAKDEMKNTVNINSTVDIPRTIVYGVGHKELSAWLDSGVLDAIAHDIRENKDYSDVKLNTPIGALKSSTYFVKAYIPYGIDRTLSLYGTLPYEAVEPRRAITVDDLFLLYPTAGYLWERVSYISLLVEHCKDRVQKASFRQRLMEAYCASYYLQGQKQSNTGRKNRRVLYRSLSHIERAIREATEAKDSITAYDYNEDGLKEYVCQMECFTACISLIGGSVFSLDTISGSYTDNDRRLKKFDGYNDDYRRGLFCDHLFTLEQYSSYMAKAHTTEGTLAASLYSPLTFAPQKHRLSMEILATVGDKDSGKLIRMQKQYIVTGATIQVQYIVKNESDSDIYAKLVIESNFSDATLEDEEGDTSLVDPISHYKIEVPLVDCFTPALETEGQNVLTIEPRGGVVDTMSVVRISDSASGDAFVFEPNEEASFIAYPLPIMRPQGESLKCINCPLVTAIAWDIRLKPRGTPGSVIEKTLNLSILNKPHKGQS